MIPYRSLSFIILGILACTSQASAGWVIDQAVKGSGEGGKQQIILQANQMKTVVLAPDGKPEAAFIMDLNAETITQVNYQERSYMTARVQEYAQIIQGAMKGAMGEMEKAMKDMSPEERQMMEQMMGSKMPQAGPKSGACREPRIEMRKTGQEAKIAGYKAVGYEVLADGKPQSELWISKDIPAWKELDPKKLERVMGELVKAAPRCGPASGRQAGMGGDQTWKLAGEGYPVKTVDRSGSGATVEVTKAESRAVPASEFQPPANFARKTLSEMMGHER